MSSNLNSSHTQQLLGFLNYYESKTDEVIQDVKTAFTETQDGLEEEIFNQDESEEVFACLLEAMQDLVSNNVRQNSNQMVQFLNQFLLQAEGQAASIVVNPSILDDAKLCQMVGDIHERSKNTGEEVVSSVEVSGDRDANLMSRILSLEEENKSYQFRFARLQEQMLKAVAENKALTEENTANDAKLTGLQSDITNLNNSNTGAQEAELKQLEADLAARKTELRGTTKQMDGRLRNSSQMKALKAKLQNVNGTISGLRKQIRAL